MILDDDGKPLHRYHHDIWSGSVIEHVAVPTPEPPEQSNSARYENICKVISEAEAKRLLRVRRWWGAAKDRYRRTHTAKQLAALERAIANCRKQSLVRSPRHGYGVVTSVGDTFICVQFNPKSAVSIGFNYPEAFYAGDLVCVTGEEAAKARVRKSGPAVAPKKTMRKRAHQAKKAKAEAQNSKGASTSKKKAHAGQTTNAQKPVVSKEPKKPKEPSAFARAVCASSDKASSRMVIKNGRLLCRKCGYEAKPGSGTLICPKCSGE